RTQKHCSFIVADGVAIIPAGPLTGFDAETGKVLWTHETIKASWASPVRWPSGGKTYILVRAGGKIVCLAPKTGSILWSVDEGRLSDIYAGSTPAIEGDRMAVGRQSGVRLYKLTAEKAELLWDVKSPMDYCFSPTIYKGHVYVFGRNGATCINLDAGKVAWQDKAIKTGAYHSPILADGKIFLQGYDKKRKGFGDGSLVMIPASADKGQVLAQAKISQALCTTPAVVDGRIFCRLRSRVACYDLRK
ncbi:hypothetical protein LCGC14_1694710, partial [marine sediment metagenome]